MVGSRDAILETLARVLEIERSFRVIIIDIDIGIVLVEIRIVVILTRIACVICMIVQLLVAPLACPCRVETYLPWFGQIRLRRMGDSPQLKQRVYLFVWWSSLIFIVLVYVVCCSQILQILRRNDLHPQRILSDLFPRIGAYVQMSSRCTTSFTKLVKHRATILFWLLILLDQFLLLQIALRDQVKIVGSFLVRQLLFMIFQRILLLVCEKNVLFLWFIVKL